MLRLGKVVGYVDGKRPGEFTEEDAKHYIQKRKTSGAKDWTVRHEQVVLRKLIDYLGGENPTRNIPLIQAEDEIIPRAFTRADLYKFMRLVKNRRMHLHGYLRPVTLTYLYAGLRPSELVRLTHSDIKAGKILIQGATKTGRARSVEIHPRLMPHISACLRKNGKYLFGGDVQLRPETIGLTLRRVISDAGLEEVTPYSLRHTFITGLLRAGADLRYVMDKAGHRKLTTTTRYLHVIETEDSPVRHIKF
ncbi:MAG: site-specific integrase [Deltaproteobacteria bacterium]|nr:site-specific integrase [Deltaproteobacteria bacterium]